MNFGCLRFHEYYIFILCVLYRSGRCAYNYNRAKMSTCRRESVLLVEYVHLLYTYVIYIIWRLELYQNMWHNWVAIDKA